MVRTTRRAARVQQPWEIVLDPRRSSFLGSCCPLSTIPRQFCLFPFPSLLSAGPSIPSGSAWFMGNPTIPTWLGPSPPRSPLAFPPLASARDSMAWLIPQAQHPSINAGWSSRLTETDAESRTNVTILNLPQALNPKPRFAPFPMPNPPHPRAYRLVSPVSRMVKYSRVEIWPCAVRIHLSAAGREWLITLGSTAVPRHTPLEKVCTPSSTPDPCAVCSGWVYF